jgi:hypothetical protein
MANTNKLTPEGVSLTGKIVQIWVETEPKKKNKKESRIKLQGPPAKAPAQGTFYP